MTVDTTHGLAELYRAEWDYLVRYAARWTRNRDDAQDAAAEAFATAVVEIDTVRPANPQAWLTTITRHRALGIARGYPRTTPAGDAIDRTPDLQTAPDTNAGACMADPDAAAYVAAALAELAPREREALTLWAVDGLTWPQVAARMGITPNSARRSAYASLARLRAT